MQVFVCLCSSLFLSIARLKEGMLGLFLSITKCFTSEKGSIKSFCCLAGFVPPAKSSQKARAKQKESGAAVLAPPSNHAGDFTALKKSRHQKRSTSLQEGPAELSERHRSPQSMPPNQDSAAVASTEARKKRKPGRPPKSSTKKLGGDWTNRELGDGVPENAAAAVVDTDPAEGNGIPPETATPAEASCGRHEDDGGQASRNNVKQMALAGKKRGRPRKSGAPPESGEEAASGSKPSLPPFPQEASFIFNGKEQQQMYVFNLVVYVSGKMQDMNNIKK